MKEIEYSKTALKALKSMPQDRSERIRKKITAYAADPTSQKNNMRSLRGRPLGTLRLRVGKWRIIFSDGDALKIIEIEPRGSAYKE